ncbi:MAG: hypothetical protein E4H14_19680 [Candidatus Thorarchaeota archaeon]|nr:MAG: hypothetical protein E4H14_19680 [Candidatus Thorarchaeota archaeon]
MNTISWDWKYHDVAGEGSSQWSFLQFAFYNGTNYFLEMYMGRGDDYMDGNSSTTARIRVPGFGTRDSWEHTELDLYDIMQEVGFIDLKISSILFETYYYGGILGERVEVLIDNFSMETHPLANPSFEYLDPYSTYDPFQGWWRYSSNGEVTPSTMMHSYSYSANITVAPFGAGTADGLYRSELYFEFDPSLFIDFWWRLEDIQSTSETCAWMDLEFINHLGGNSYLRYIVGRSSAYVISNTTNVKWIDANGFNQTSSWNQLYRNVTADIENAFSISADDWELYQVMTLVYADAGMRTSLLIDDFNYKDGVPPSIDSVTPPSSVMYYDTGYVRTVASDVRPGVARVVVNYTTDSWSTWHTTTGSYSTVNDWFNVFIPMQAYGTTVEFYVIAIDGGGLETIDDNGGSFYSYTVGDDVIPSVSFTTPSFFEEIEGQVSIVIEAVDSGSGVAFVELYIDSGVSMPLVMNDTVAPYEYTWNTDVEDLGTYTLYANVVDNAGLSNGAIVNVTVVDTLAPELNSPDDIEFTVGETGYTIDWDPTDVRPYGYVVYLDGAFYQFNNWNSSSEHIVIDLDGLAVGTYNFTCVVVDGTINGAIDTVFVTVNEAVVTTPTGASSTTTTTSGPTGGGDLMTPLLVVAIVGVVGILLVVFIVLPKMKKT